MPVRVHPDKSGLTSRAFVATGSDCAYCWAASAAVHSSAEWVQAATPTTPSSTTTGLKRHEIEITQRPTALIRGALQAGRGDISQLRLDRRRQHAVIDVLDSRRIGLRADAQVVAFPSRRTSHALLSERRPRN